MGTRIQVFSPRSSSFSAVVAPEFHAFGEAPSSSSNHHHHHIVVSRKSSIHLCNTRLKQVVSSRKTQWRKCSSAALSGELAGYGTLPPGQSQNSLECFLPRPSSSGGVQQPRRVGVLCSLNSSSVPPASKDSSSAHSNSLPPPSAVSLGTHGSTFSSGTQSFVDSVTTSEGSFIESVTRPEEFDLTEGGGFSLQVLEGPEDQNGNLLDPELQGILENIADMQRQNEMLTEQMKEFQQLLTKTTRSLNVKAQEAKIEAAKLKKLSKLHQLEEIRKADEVRRKVLEARIQEDLKERTSLQDAYRRRRFMEEEEEFGLAQDGSDSNVVEPSSLRVEEGVLLHYEEEVNDSSGESSADRRNEEVSGARETLECVILHPGALSCTKTVIKSDPGGKSAQVMMETTVSCAGDACLLTSLNEDDYVALAVQTLSDTARELKSSRFQRATDSDPVQHRKHQEIAKILATGRIVKARPMEPPSKFGHESFVVRLLNKQTGQKTDAMCKPGIEGHADGWHRAAIELVAYELNLMLGMDYVPPVAYRSGGMDVNYKHYNDGAFVYYVPNTVPLRKVPATKWGVSVAMLLSDTRILDVLLNNSDRHHGHFLFGEHWADGKMRPVLIDHAAGFRKEAVVKMDHENAFQTGPVRCVSSKTYLRLRFLERQVIENKFKGILSSEEVNKMMQRRDMILSYLDSLVAERGYHKTVIET